MSDLKSQALAIESQMRESLQKLEAICETLVLTSARAAKPMLYARELLRRALAEVESLNREAERE